VFLINEKCVFVRKGVRLIFLLVQKISEKNRSQEQKNWNGKQEYVQKTNANKKFRKALKTKKCSIVRHSKINAESQTNENCSLNVAKTLPFPLPISIPPAPYLKLRLVLGGRVMVLPIVYFVDRLVRRLFFLRKLLLLVLALALLGRPLFRRATTRFPWQK
jgi:hypothetical protein